MRILVSGASGFIGSALFLHLRSLGHHVVPLSREKKEGAVFWNPEKREAAPSDFEGWDAVVHLAGERLAFGRWSRKKKGKIWASRVESTRFLVSLLKGAKKPPSVFISASAIGFYGEGKEALLTEDSPPGGTFLARVCQDWEEASCPLEELGVRRVLARFGVVFDPEGGPLAELLRLFRWGLGAVLGSGEQWVSWISRADLVRALSLFLEDSRFSGAVNCVSSYPLRQKELAAALSQQTRRPCWLKIPAWLLRLGLGKEASEMALVSARVRPEKLLERGFCFHNTSLPTV